MMFLVLICFCQALHCFSAISNELLYLPHVCIVSCQEGPLPAKSSSQILSSEICMIFKQPDEVYTSKYIERTPHYIYFTTWSLINLRSSGLLSAISIAYESNCSATCLSGELTVFSIKERTQNLNARTASSQWVVVIPSSLTWLITPVASKNSTPSSITWFKMDKMVNTLDFTFAYGSILSGSKGDSASWRESLRLSWAQARNTFRSSVTLVLDNNSWCQFQDGHLELRIIDPINQVKGFKASVIPGIAAHTWIQFLILERKKLG